MIDIKVYSCNADNRLVDKTNSMTLVKDFPNCVLKKVTSIMDIELTFELNNMTELANCNYVYIPSLNTYYYINDIIFGSGKQVTIQCHEDVLMTYKDEILQLSCVIARQENVFNTYLDDDRYRLLNTTRTQTFTFPSGFNNQNSHFVMAIAGGGS